MTPLQRTRQRLIEYLLSLQIGFEEDEANNRFTLTTDSGLLVFLHYYAWGDESENTNLWLRSYPFFDVEPSPKLYRFIATHQPFFGALHVETNDDGETSVALQHTMLADYLDEPELQHALVTFAIATASAATDLNRVFGAEFGA